jgi:hypothetical protein
MKQTIIGDTVFSAFLKLYSLILSLSSTFFVYKDMHIIYHFKAFEKGFQMNVNASRNISNTFQSTLKNSGDINWSIFVRMSVLPLILIVTVCVFVCHLFSFYPFYFDFHSARIIFDVSSGFYLWNINRTIT